jgi:hypothetical protein
VDIDGQQNALVGHDVAQQTHVAVIDIGCAAQRVCKFFNERLPSGFNAKQLVNLIDIVAHAIKAM